MRPLRIGVDAVNLRGGGGVTHLVQLLQAASPDRHGFDRITVWSGRATLERFPHDRSWLDLRSHSMLDRSLPHRVAWRRAALERQAEETSDVLFAPGGLVDRGSIPRITMVRNMLTFDPAERRRYPLSDRFRWHLEVLRRLQARSFCRADGVIFLNDYARRSVTPMLGSAPRRTAVIPHGVADRFRAAPRPPRPLSAVTPESPLRLLYVSTVNLYKHQWHVVEAVARLRAEGLSVRLVLVGRGERRAMRRLEAAVARFDPGRVMVDYRGAVEFGELHALYREAELFVFASSCENLPNILLEAMAAGLPIASSSRGPMPDLLGDAGTYFDPEDPASVAAALRVLTVSPERRAHVAALAHDAARAYTWDRCADRTFAFLRDVYVDTVRETSAAG